MNKVTFGLLILVIALTSSTSYFAYRFSKTNQPCIPKDFPGSGGATSKTQSPTPFSPCTNPLCDNHTSANLPAKCSGIHYGNCLRQLKQFGECGDDTTKSTQNQKKYILY
jgi:hypothetical protein